MTCSLCGRFITLENERTAWRQVIGFERPTRGAGGQSGSSIVFRKPTGAFACAECITRVKAGFPPTVEQPPLFE
jgi:uncharacterized protein YlaI